MFLKKTLCAHVFQKRTLELQELLKAKPIVKYMYTVYTYNLYINRLYK